MTFDRYNRQTLLPEIGLEGQKRLSEARVLLIGAGGLGCPAALYLAGAGIGTLGIADADTVSLTNLHRQILHPEANVGKNKAESAAEMLKKRNAEVEIRTYPFYVTPDNILDLIRDYDFVIDAVDGFETKFLINDACVLAGKPFIHAGVVQLHGQIFTYVPGKGPCLRCIFEEMPPEGSVPRCAQVGVLGPVCGIIGCMEAAEAIKYLAGSDTAAIGSLIQFDAVTMKSRPVRFHASEGCRVCGPHADIKDVADRTQVDYRM